MPSSLSAGWLGLAYLGLSLASSAPDPLWLLSLLSFLPILPANSVAMRVNQKLDAGFVANGSFSLWNWVAMVIGLSFVMLILVAFAFVPEIMMEPV